MPYQLLYTSVPGGLRPGTSGYTTAAHTEGMPSELVAALEARSGYDHVASKDPSFTRGNPVISRYEILQLQAGTFFALSRIQDSGSDHTGRTNYLAQYLVFDANEITQIQQQAPEINPASILSLEPEGVIWRSPDLVRVEYLQPLDNNNLIQQLCNSVAKVDLSDGAVNWGRAQDKSCAPAMLEGGLQSKCCLSYPPDQFDWPLYLFSETLRIAIEQKNGVTGQNRSPQEAWRYTFTTFVQAGEAHDAYIWCGFSGPALNEEKAKGTPIYDIFSRQLPVATDERLVSFAQTGAEPALPEPTTPPAGIPAGIPVGGATPGVIPAGVPVGGAIPAGARRVAGAGLKDVGALSTRSTQQPARANTASKSWSKKRLIQIAAGIIILAGIGVAAFLTSQKEDQEVQQIAQNPREGSETNNTASKPNDNPSDKPLRPTQENGKGENNPTTPPDPNEGGNTSTPPEPEQTELDKFIAGEFKKWLKDESLVEYNKELRTINNFVSINLESINLNGTPRELYNVEVKHNQIPALDSLFTNANSREENLKDYTFEYNGPTGGKPLELKYATKGQFTDTTWIHKYGFSATNGDFDGVKVHADYIDPAKPAPATKYIISGEMSSYYDFESKDKKKCRIHIGGFIPSGFKYTTHRSEDQKYFHKILLLNPEVQEVISNKERFQFASYANSELSVREEGVGMKFPGGDKRNYTEGVALVYTFDIQKIKSDYIKEATRKYIDRLNSIKYIDSLALEGFTRLVAEKKQNAGNKKNYDIVIKGIAKLDENKSYIAIVKVPTGTTSEDRYYECEVDKNSEAGPRVIVKKALARKPEIEKTYREHFLNPKPSFVKPSVSLVHRIQLTPENIAYLKREQAKKIKADAEIYLGSSLKQSISYLAVELRNRSTDPVGQILLLQH